MDKDTYIVKLLLTEYLLLSRLPKPAFSNIYFINNLAHMYNRALHPVCLNASK